MPFKVSLYFTDDESAVITVEALDLESAIKKVAQMIEDKKVIVKPEGHYAKGYNLALVRQFHISAK